MWFWGFYAAQNCTCLPTFREAYWSYIFNSQAVQDEYFSRAAWSLNKESIVFPETSETNYESTLRKITKGRRPHSHSDGSVSLLTVTQILTRNTENGKFVLFSLTFIDLNNKFFHLNAVSECGPTQGNRIFCIPN